MGAGSSEFRPVIFPENLDWSPAKQLGSLEQLRDFVERKCLESIGWYDRSRGRKKKGGFWFRLLALLAFTVSALIPVLAEIFREGDKYPFSPTWATVAALAAAFFLSMDRFGDFTSGWVRYMRTPQALEALHCDFRFKWQALRCSWPAHPVDNTPAEAGIAACKEFVCGLHEIVRKETDQWAQEFQQVLADFESKLNKNS